jgi:hypothetical protein
MKSSTPSVRGAAGKLVVHGIATLTVACITVGCFVRHGSRAWFDEGARATLERRAAFDLSCAVADVQISPLGSRHAGAGDEDYTTVGVAGCGSKATYVHVGGEWVMNSSSGARGGVAGGAVAPPDARQPPSATAASLLRDVRESKAKVVISQRKAEEPGLGRIAMSVDGKPVWPPRGDDCGALVSCCDKQRIADDRFELLCQFAMVREGECSGAMRTVTRVASELSQPIDASCRAD